MKIITNNQPRNLVTFHDLTLRDQKDFDYVTDDAQYENRFVNYKGSWYDIYDTQRISVNVGQFMGWTMAVDKDSPLIKWNAIVSETFFSGVLFRFTDEDQIVCGRYYS